PERALAGGDDFGAAGMTDKPVDIAKSEPLPREEIARRGAEAVGNERGDVARENRLEPVFGDIPPHHVEAVGPGMLAAGQDRRSRPAASQQCPGGAVAEQGAGDDVAFPVVVAAESERA